MRVWLDAHLSPALCAWLAATFGIEAESALNVGMLEADDATFFDEAKRRQIDAIMTKDQDFAELVERIGPPPQVIWLTVGNTSNRNLKRILQATLADAIAILKTGEPLVEISDAMPGEPAE